MYGDGLVVFGVGLGYFEAVGFQKRNLAHYMYGDALVGFGMVMGVSMDRTTAMLTDQMPYRFTDSSASRCRLTHDIWYPARCSAAHKN